MSDHGNDLAAVIDRCFNKKDARTMRSFFENKTVGDRLLLDLDAGAISAHREAFLLAVIDGLRSYPQDKYPLVCRLEELFAHLHKRHGIFLDPQRLGNFKYRNRTERLFMMLKSLHSGERSRTLIAEDFGISERTLADDLALLLDGYDFMGCNLKVEALEWKKNTYRSRIHPLFLPLNTAEIYAMTIGLKLISRETVFEGGLSRVADIIYGQLSVYARDLLKDHIDKHEIYFSDNDNRFINTHVLMMQKERPFEYFLKERVLCRLEYEEDGVSREARGYLHLPVNNPGFRKILLEGEDGECRMIEKEQVRKISPCE